MDHSPSSLPCYQIGVAFALAQLSPVWQNADFVHELQRQAASVEVDENTRVAVSSEQMQRAAMLLGLTLQ